MGVSFENETLYTEGVGDGEYEQLSPWWMGWDFDCFNLRDEMLLEMFG